MNNLNNPSNFLWVFMGVLQMCECADVQMINFNNHNNILWVFMGVLQMCK
jgi:uncharacterized protein (DUF362 family)